MLQKMNTMVKKTLLILMISVLLGGSIFPIQGTTHAQPPNNPNGAQAATVRWISELSSEILAMYLARSLPAELFNIDFSWRNQEIKDEDGQTKSPERQRLLRWDRRPPNEILVNGFIPQVTNENPNLLDTDLFHYVRSNTKSIFVSTTKTRYKNSKRYQPWTPRSSARGIIYQYEIFAPGGVDVNNSFGDRSPWPNQLEVAFPGGIRPEFIRSVRELQGGRIQRIWINPNFQDPGNLEGIAASSSTKQVMWHPDHPDGNHKDPNAYRSFNPDADMSGANGEVPDKEELPVLDQRFPDGEYLISSSIDINKVADFNDKGVTIYDVNKKDHQMWKFTYNHDKRAYKITSVSNPDKALTWSKDHKIDAITGNNPNQYWNIEKTSDGYFILRNLMDWYWVIDLKNSGTDNGNPLQVRKVDKGKKEQKWAIRPKIAVNQTIEDGEYLIKSSYNPNKVADFNDKGVTIYDVNNGNHQKWKFTYNDTKQAYKITSVSNPDKALTWVKDSGKIDGQTGDSDYQYWDIERTSNGYFILRNMNNRDIVLDLNKSNTENGNSLQGYGYNGTKAQQWEIKPVDPLANQTIEDGEYLIASSIDPNKVADSNDKGITMYDANYKKHQTWRFTYNKDKQAYKITSVSNPKLALTWDSKDSDKIFGYAGDYDSQYWRVERTSDGYFKLKNYKNPNMVLDVAGANTENGTQLQAYEDNGGKNQKWSLQRVDAAIIPNGTYNISSIKDYKKVIDHDYPKSKAMLREYMGLSSSEWKFEWNDSKKAYKIRTQKYDNLGLVYQNKGFHVTVNNVDGTNQDDNRLYWIIEYDNARGGYVFRSLYEPSQVLGSQGTGVEIITDQSKFDINQVWNLMPRK
ncbi:RICIN domain-containing protein [Paenibacillus larvae]|uniref:scabin-related ADP-ribosyltransferase n=1 Tax=Paenibacillus larvae TaxID=1464 RepID=UPI002DBD5927|nr:RICIN domain-containing protein [Paenibacillus larvae]MEC0186767.1 RICIN domain-containing protein [Paenibacillus larvae]